MHIPIYTLSFLVQTQNVFAPLELGHVFDDKDKARGPIGVVVGETLSFTSAPRHYPLGFLGKHGLEIRPGSGEFAYFEACIHASEFQSISIGLASEGLVEHKVGFGRWLGYAAGGFGWNVNGYIHSRLSGARENEMFPNLKANDGDRIGIMVDCSQEPTIRFFINGLQSHHLCVGEEGYYQRVFPAFHLINAQINIVSNPELPHI